MDALIDIEGCGGIFSRLVGMCDGDEQSALGLVASSNKTPLSDDLRVVQQWIQEIESCQFDRTSYGSNFPQKSDLARKLFELTSENVSVVKMMDKEAQEAWLQSLTKEDCISFLQLWLLALGAKDASLMLTLSTSSPPQSPPQSPPPPLTPPQYTWKHVSHLIDIGPKPLSKIISKVAEEDSICRIANNSARHISKKFFEQLPQCVWQLLIQYLDGHDIVGLSTCCKFSRVFIRHIIQY